LHDKLFNASHASLVFFTETSSLFWLNYTKMLIKQHFPCLYGSEVVYDFIKVSFRCFVLFILIKVKSHNLPWLIVGHWGPEVWNDQFQFTERSFPACNTFCHRQHYLQSNSKNVRTR